MTFDDQTSPRFDIELRTLYTFSNCMVETYALSVDVSMKWCYLKLKAFPDIL